jgi:hypothetical protein
MAERFVQNKSIIQSQIGDEIVMLDVDSGFYFGLNSVGSIIWTYLKEPVSHLELIEKLLEQFEIDRDTCEKETEAFLLQLLEKNIVRKVA